MAERYTRTPRQAVVLRALNERLVEASPTEIAVSGLLPLGEVKITLAALEQAGFVSSWPVESQAVEEVFEMTNRGQAVVRALDPVKGTPSVGSVARLSQGRLLGLFTGEKPKYVEIVSDGTG